MQVITHQQTITNDTQSTGKQNRWSFILRIIVWQIIALLFVELILFWAGLGEEEIFDFDRTLGTKHMASKRITWRTEGYAQSYFNADGMREPNLTIAKPANTYRVALLGDSMVEGLQVPIESTFGQILGRKFSQPHSTQVQVLNFGTSGYSTVQEYLQLKNQVLKYHPDLVILGYNSRDIFENWAPPDQMLTNVRPLALHLPHGKLIVSNVPVLDWMRSPRAKFLMQINWLRQHSRIWGLTSALELEMGLHSPLYKAIMHFFTEPTKSIKELGAAITEMFNTKPAFNINTFEDTNANQQSGANVNQHPAKTSFKPEFNSAAPNSVLEKNPVAQSSKHADAGYENYIALMNRTLGSLIQAMNSECAASGIKFAVITVPVKASLCPDGNPEKSVFDVGYPQEISMVKKICQTQNIPMYDCEQEASKLPISKREELFYMIHLTPTGHIFVANELEQFIAQLIGTPIYKK